MKYDASLPIAVFLGPSLDAEAARALLPANYYPPVRMGDVYRLLTTGVRLIVIIDGVFHKATPVWQREILAALRQGITVVGASSMGALRAVELDAYGMIGLGTVVDWYRSGVIEGDDEVALQHADADFSYRALSDPLVNIRWNLERAEKAGVVSAEQRVALIADMHALDHTRRSYQALFGCAAFSALPKDTQAGLRQFVADCSVSLKARDAAAALTWCAERLPDVLTANAPASGDPRGIRPPQELLLRGVPAPDGSLRTVQELLTIAVSDRERTAHIVHHAARRFYVLEWAAHANVHAPGEVIEAYASSWAATHGIHDRSAWLVANAMTPAELRQGLFERASADWLLERGPADVGLDRPFLEAWAELNGVERPADISGSEAFRAWLVHQTPAHFGSDRWSADAEFVRELQLTGELSRLAGERVHARAV